VQVTCGLSYFTLPSAVFFNVYYERVVSLFVICKLTMTNSTQVC